MKIFYSPYQLKSLERGTREGALLKVEKDGFAGFADVHPWRSFGDLSLSEQLEKIKQEQPTDLGKQSLWFALEDLRARQEKRSLLLGAEQICHNLLITNLSKITDAELGKAKEQGFGFLKLKVGQNLEFEKTVIARLAQMGFRLRLDYNAKTTARQLEDYLLSFDKNILQAIEYIEDPCPYEKASWLRLKQIVPLAIDQEFINDQNAEAEKSPPPYQVLVLKPAKFNIEIATQLIQKWKLKLTVTSYLDHPVGVMHALAVATRLKSKYGEQVLTAGCLTLKQDEPNEFHQLIRQHGPSLQGVVSDFGIGFTELLQRQKWIALN